MLGYCFVGGEHEFFDELMAEAMFAEMRPGNDSVLIQFDFCFLHAPAAQAQDIAVLDEI